MKMEAEDAKREAKDAAREQRAIREAVEEAKTFREYLEAEGISYTTLLHLPLGKFRAVPQALVRQARPVPAPGKFRINHVQGLPDGPGDLFRGVSLFP